MFQLEGGSSHYVIIINIILCLKQHNVSLIKHRRSIGTQKTKVQKVTLALTKVYTVTESPEWLDDQVGGQFYGYVTGIANLSCEAEAEPPPSFRWLDAENKPVVAGSIINEEYKVIINARYCQLHLSSCQCSNIQIIFYFVSKDWRQKFLLLLNGCRFLGVNLFFIHAG